MSVNLTFCIDQLEFLLCLEIVMGPSYEILFVNFSKREGCI